VKELSEINVELIYPATEKLIKKYTAKESFLMLETAEFYKKVYEKYLYSFTVYISNGC
jgi:hypothetical protein